MAKTLILKSTKTKRFNPKTNELWFTPNENSEFQDFKRCDNLVITLDRAWMDGVNTGDIFYINEKRFKVEKIFDPHIGENEWGFGYSVDVTFSRKTWFNFLFS